MESLSACAVNFIEENLLVDPFHLDEDVLESHVCLLHLERVLLGIWIICPQNMYLWVFSQTTEVFIMILVDLTYVVKRVFTRLAFFTPYWLWIWNVFVFRSTRVRCRGNERRSRVVSRVEVMKIVGGVGGRVVIDFPTAWVLADEGGMARRGGRIAGQGGESRLHLFFNFIVAAYESFEEQVSLSYFLKHFLGVSNHTSSIWFK